MTINYLVVVFVVLLLFALGIDLYQAYLNRRTPTVPTNGPQYRYCGGKQETERRKRQLDRGVIRLN